MLLFHIAEKEKWNQSLKSKYYGNFSITKDGFIHCAKFDQLEHVANNNLKNINKELVILCIDVSRLNSEVRWETNKKNNIVFPHVYGLVNVDCVVDAIDFKKNQNGEFFISDELLNFSHYEKSCGAIVFHKFDNEYKILLVQFEHNKELRWGFPKGHIEQNETEIQAAEREVKEEVGLSIKIVSDFRASTNFSMKPGTIMQAIYYCAESLETDTNPQESEVKKATWFKFSDALNCLTYKCDKKILLKFIDFFQPHN